MEENREDSRLLKNSTRIIIEAERVELEGREFVAFD